MQCLCLQVNKNTRLEAHRVLGNHRGSHAGGQSAGLSFLRASALNISTGAVARLSLAVFHVHVCLGIWRNASCSQTLRQLIPGCMGLVFVSTLPRPGLS